MSAKLDVLTGMVQVLMNSNRLAGITNAVEFTTDVPLPIDEVAKFWEHNELLKAQGTKKESLVSLTLCQCYL
jgi:hypothetical protein